jgi:hypothetical protein
VQQLAEWIQAEVPEAADWTFYAEEPIAYPNSPCCVVWWDNAGPNPDANTIAIVGGWLGSIDTYGVRYTEPATDQGRLLKDEARGEQLEAIMDAVVAVVFNHTKDLTVANCHDLRWTGHARIAPTEGFLRSGFEVSFQVNREIPYS